MLDFKIFTEGGELTAATRHAEDAAALVGMLGAGTTVQNPKGWILWWEGQEKFSAAESYDGAAALMIERDEGDGPQLGPLTPPPQNKAPEPGAGELPHMEAGPSTGAGPCCRCGGETAAGHAAISNRVVCVKCHDELGGFTPTLFYVAEVNELAKLEGVWRTADSATENTYYIQGQRYESDVVDDKGRRCGTLILLRYTTDHRVAIQSQATRDGKKYGAIPRESVCASIREARLEGIKKAKRYRDRCARKFDQRRPFPPVFVGNLGAST